MEAVDRLHTLRGIALLGLLLVPGLVIGALALVDRRLPAAFEPMRRVALALLVIEAALGLVLAFRGMAPAETIHWLYGGLILLVLLLPGSVAPAATQRVRTGIVAGSWLLAAVLAWRLWGSG